MVEKWCQMVEKWWKNLTYIKRTINYPILQIFGQIVNMYKIVLFQSKKQYSNAFIFSLANSEKHLCCMAASNYLLEQAFCRNGEKTT